MRRKKRLDFLTNTLVEAEYREEINRRLYRIVTNGNDSFLSEEWDNSDFALAECYNNYVRGCRVVQKGDFKIFWQKTKKKGHRGGKKHKKKKKNKNHPGSNSTITDAGK